MISTKSFIAALAFTTTTLASCYGPREAKTDKENKFKEYSHLMNCPSGDQFGVSIANEGFEKNAATKPLNAGTRTDKNGVHLFSGFRKLLFDFNHGLTFQYYAVAIQCDKKQMGYRFITPIHALLAKDSDTKAAIDKRYNQAKMENDKLASAEELMAHTMYDEKTNTYIEDIRFNDKMPGQLLYNMNLKEISFLCPGFAPQHICFLKNANEQLKARYQALNNKHTDMALKPL